MSTPSEPMNAAVDVPRPERIISAIQRLCENINDHTSSIRSLKGAMVGDPPTARDEEKMPEKDIINPDNFMDKLEQAVAHCEVAHEKALHEINDFRNKAL